MTKPKPAKRVSRHGKTVTIKKLKRVFSGFLKIDQAELTHARYDGTRQTVTRQSMERGDSVAVMLIDRPRKKIWLTEQFRFPTLNKGPGWIIELPAGAQNPGEKPVDAARREIIEETGFKPRSLKHVATFYVSPGGTSERIILYYALINSASRDADLSKRTRDKDEDIKLVDWDLDDFLKKAGNGLLDDAKTLIAGLWLLANKKRLKL